MFTTLGRTAALITILGALAACASATKSAPGSTTERGVSPSTLIASPTASNLRSRWVPVTWGELPGWGQDRVSELWPALRQGCARPPEDWVELCKQAVELGDTEDDALRNWMQQHLKPYRVESRSGSANGLITGYYEPEYTASRTPKGAYSVPLYSPPPELASRKIYWTRKQIDTLPIAQAQMRGREIAYLSDPLDALILQIQGSGRLRVLNADGSSELVRAAFAGHNGQRYRSVARWLIDQGELKRGQALWPAIKAWARMNPGRVNELLWSNPRVVFFREERLPNPALGPRGAQAVPLTPGRSIAVDTQSIPLGALVWLNTSDPVSNTPLRRLVVAQDTGAAIVGAVRADYFWGWGKIAERQASRMKQALRMWVLWPQVASIPDGG